MAPVQSDFAALLIGAPMVLLLIGAFFRLDTLMGNPRKPLQPGRRLTNWDANGVPVCDDPAPTGGATARRKYTWKERRQN